jgi:hypothetical protein
MKKILLYIVIGGIVLFGLIQLIPIDRSNPPTTQEPNWSSPEARALVKQNCFDCHSNETVWPWYGYVAPVSWLLYFDIYRGRNEFNFSEWDKNPGRLNEMVREIQQGSMPPLQYKIIHTDTNLDAQHKQALIDALTTSLK